jgi:hypothetical protein
MPAILAADFSRFFDLQTTKNWPGGNNRLVTIQQSLIFLLWSHPLLPRFREENSAHNAPVCSIGVQRLRPDFIIETPPIPGH